MSSIVGCLLAVRGLVLSLTVEPVLFIDSLAFGLADTATRALAFDRVCTALVGDDATSADRRASITPSWSSCPVSNLTSDQLDAVHRDASRLEFYRTLCVAVPAFFLVVIYSNLSDRWSRKYVILLGPAGSVASLAICLLVAVNPGWPPAALLAASVATGLAGGFVTLLGACLGYLTAVVMTTASDGPPGSTSTTTGRPPWRRNRVLRLAVAEAFMQASRTASYAASGKLLATVGPATVFAIGIGLNAVLAIYVVVRLDNITPTTTIAAAETLSASVGQMSDDGDEHPTSGQPTTRRTKSERSGSSASAAVTADTDSLCELSAETSLSDMPSGRSSVVTTTSDKPNDADLDRRNGEVCVSEDRKLTSRLSAERCGRWCCWSGWSAAAGRVEPFWCFGQDRDSCCCLPQTGARCGWSKVVPLIGQYSRDYIRTLTRRRHGNRRLYLLVVVAMAGVEALSLQTIYEGLTYLFLLHAPLNFSTELYGYYRGVGWAVKGICLVVVLPVCERLLAVSDTALIVLGQLSALASVVLLGASQTVWMPFAAQPVALFENGLMIVERSLAVSFVEEHEYGKLFGILAALQALASIVGSALFSSWIYPATVDVFPGTAILAAGSLLLPLIGLSFWLHSKVTSTAQLKQDLQDDGANEG